MSKFTPRKLKSRLERFEEAVRDHAFKGSRHPGDHESIEREYQESKQALLELTP